MDCGSIRGIADEVSLFRSHLLTACSGGTLPKCLSANPAVVRRQCACTSCAKVGGGPIELTPASDLQRHLLTKIEFCDRRTQPRLNVPVQHGDKESYAPQLLTHI